MMVDRSFARALLMAGELDGRQQDLLQILCAAHNASLMARLRDGIAPEDCPEEFVTAVSLLALEGLGDFDGVCEFKAGDLTVKTGTEQSAGDLAQQAERLMAPYLQDRFAFVGV